MKPSLTGGHFSGAFRSGKFLWSLCGLLNKLFAKSQLARFWMKMKYCQSQIYCMPVFVNEILKFENLRIHIEKKILSSKYLNQLQWHLNQFKNFRQKWFQTIKYSNALSFVCCPYLFQLFITTSQPSWGWFKTCWWVIFEQSHADQWHPEQHITNEEVEINNLKAININNVYSYE